MTRTYTLLLAVLAVSLAACGSALRSESSSLPALDGYTLMKMPKADLPVGARWRPGIGHDGPGLPPSRLDTEPAPTALETSAQFQSGLAAKLAATLGLSADAQRTSKLVASNLTVVRIKNLNDDQLEPGNQILHTGLRAGEITFTYRSGLSAEAQATVTAQARSLGLAIGSSGSEETVLTGRNLFVAFRVISIAEPEIKVVKTKGRAAERIKVGNYEISVDPKSVLDCMCRGRGVGALVPQDVASACYAQMPASAVAINERSGGVGTGGKEIQFKYHLRQVGRPDWITLDVRNRGNKIEVDRLSFFAVLSMGNPRRCLLLHGSEFDDEYTNFELRTVTYNFSAVRTPGGEL